MVLARKTSSSAVLLLVFKVKLFEIGQNEIFVAKPMKIGLEKAKLLIGKPDTVSSVLPIKTFVN